MKRDLSLTAPTPVIAAALQRRPGVRRRRAADPGKGGGGCVFLENNFVAIARLNRGPNSGNAAGAGTRPGNRNALRTGQHTAAARADRERWRRLFEKLDVALETMVAAHQAKADLTAALRQVEAIVGEACAR